MKIIISFLLIAFMVITDSMVSNSSLLESKILNGNPVARGHMRYMVSLQVFKMHVCGGALISLRLVLTAAHCIYIIHGRPQRNWENTTISAGIGDRLSERFIHYVAFAILNPRYKHNKPYDSSNDDIGVFILRIPVLQCLVSTASLNYDRIFGGSHAIVAGWGSTRNEDQFVSMLDATMSEDLYSIKVLIRGKTYCRDIMGYGDFETYQFCADPVRNDEKTNWGDGGSPLIVNDTVIAVASGILGITPRNPMRFVRVSSFEDEFNYIFQFAASWDGGEYIKGNKTHNVIERGKFIRRITLKFL